MEDELRKRLHKLWTEIYPNSTTLLDELLEEFVNFVAKEKQEMKNCAPHTFLDGRKDNWYQNAVLYGLYVDLFSTNFQGLVERLDYLKNLGVDCLWLLPVLDSPMKDFGFDIRDYSKIRAELVNYEKDDMSVFTHFVQEAHKRGISILMDIALNHSSEEHIWFQEATEQPESEKRDYYIWSNDPSKYNQCRVIFEGICDSNWSLEKGPRKEYYFHRFLEQQPDLNYRNPRVLLEICKIILGWAARAGVDGFRADAIPFLWKEEDTTCESLPQVHSILKFMRATLDYVYPGTLILAEACQQPTSVVQYFGNGDECHAAYHFPLMVEVWHAFNDQCSRPIMKVLDPSVTPNIPLNTQWFFFLRCHDELTFEMIDEEKRDKLFKKYCKQPEWNFREGKGVSARLAELLEHNLDRINMAFSILLTLIGTPILFYGDEFGKGNDSTFFNEAFANSKIHDTRYYTRGRMDWKFIEQALLDKESKEYKIYSNLQHLLNTRRSQLTWIGTAPVRLITLKHEQSSDAPEDCLLTYTRQHLEGEQSLFCVHNLSNTVCRALLPWKHSNMEHDLLGKSLSISDTVNGSLLELKPYSYHWILMSGNVLP